MDVRIKQLDINMAVKSKGIEFEIRSPDGTTHQGDAILTMTGVTWCKGRTTKANGIKVSWDELATLCASKASLTAALKAARAV